MRTETARPTIHDVARETGLSIATVSRALHMNNSPNVSETTRERVKEAARLLGYQPNLAGRSLVTGRSNTISYWALSLFSPYYTRITENICREAARRNYHVVINGTNDPANSLEDDGAGAGSGNPLASHFDGIIACDVAYQENDYARELRTGSRPFVGIGLNTPPQCDSVTIDVLAAGQMATRHLLEAGAQHIMLLTADRERHDPRTVAYENLMQDAGREVNVVRISHNNRALGRHGIKNYIEQCRSLGRALPDAIFCQNDEVAVGCCRGLFDLGIRVPDDMLLIGCDGLDDAEYAACPISSVAFPIGEMCRTAWEFLEHRFQNPATEVRNVVLQPHIVQRQSTMIRSQG